MIRIILWISNCTWAECACHLPSNSHFLHSSVLCFLNEVHEIRHGSVCLWQSLPVPNHQTLLFLRSREKSGRVQKSVCEAHKMKGASFTGVLLLWNNAHAQLRKHEMDSSSPNFSLSTKPIQFVVHTTRQQYSHRLIPSFPLLPWPRPLILVLNSTWEVPLPHLDVWANQLLLFFVFCFLKYT